MFYIIIYYFIINDNIYYLFVALYNMWGDIMKPLKKSVSITLDADIIERIRDLAEESDRSFSQYINLVLKSYLKKYESKEKQQEE